MIDIDDELTLEQAAERAGVHYMTVYRWVRTSRLPASKRGGRWVVSRADLDHVLESANGSVGAHAGSDSRPNTLPSVDRLRERLIVGDGAGAVALIEESLTAGLDAESVHLELLTGAMRSVGQLWADGVISIAEEHRATATVRQVLGSLAHHFNRPGRRRGTIVLGAPSGDRHDLPSALLVDPLRGRGFDVIDLGADLPAEACAEAARSADRLAMVGLHTSIRLDRTISRTIEALREAIGPVPVLLGGTGIVDADHARRLGADHHAASPRQALDRLTQVEESPGN